MSSLLREEMDRVLFRCHGHTLQEFIEIHEPQDGRHFLCVSMRQDGVVEISVVRCTRVKQSVSQKLQHWKLEDSYEKTETWSLEELQMMDGRDADKDDPCFFMHFGSVRPVTAVSCAAKYSLARCLMALSGKQERAPLQLRNFDRNYIQSHVLYTDHGDCVVLAQVCFYALNLLCLSLCPVPLS